MIRTPSRFCEPFGACQVALFMRLDHTTAEMTKRDGSAQANLQRTQHTNRLIRIPLAASAYIVAALIDY